MSEQAVLAIAAHPDDIEFMMAGTLLRLKEAGYALHMLNVANGHCGTMTDDRETIIAKRWEESKAAAKTLGAELHGCVTDDLEIFYSIEQLRKVAATIREIAPSIVLVQSPQDYMEDHTNACRLAVSGAFTRGMRNFITDPERPPVMNEVTVYHALPWGLRDGLRRRVRPGQFVDITPVLPKKREALACHRSQKEWLDQSQGLDSYLIVMEEMSREVGRWSGVFEVAEGWRRHSHLGFCAEQADPLKEALGEHCRVCEQYERDLDNE